MTLEKVGLMAVAGLYESRLNLLNRQIVAVILPLLSLPSNYLIQTSVLQSSSYHIIWNLDEIKLSCYCLCFPKAFLNIYVLNQKLLPFTELKQFIRCFM